MLVKIRLNELLLIESYYLNTISNYMNEKLSVGRRVSGLSLYRVATERLNDIKQK